MTSEDISAKSFPVIINSSSTLMSKRKSFLLNGVFFVLFLGILGLCSLPTLFYYTAGKLTQTNASLARNFTLYEKSNVQPWPPLICGKPLVKGNGSCLLPCGWTVWKPDEVLQINTTTFTACILTILSFIIVLLTWFKIPQLWKFPHVIIVILVVQSTIIVSLVSLGTLLGNNVLCPSKFWDLKPGSQMTTTIFCKFEGASLHYLEGSISLWFTTYNIVVAKGLVFDGLQINPRHRLPFLISALICWLLPIIPVIFVFSSEIGYSGNFYSNYCFPGSSALVFYTAVLPENILFATGASFLNIIIWKLLKERQPLGLLATQEQARLRKNKMDSVVARLTLLMVFYAVTFCLTYGSMAYMLNKGMVIETALKSYFKCLTFQSDCSQDYRKYISHIPLVLNYVAAAIFPLSTVLFLASNEKARQLWKRPYHQLRSKFHTPSSSSMTQLLNEECGDRVLLSHA